MNKRVCRRKDRSSSADLSWADLNRLAQRIIHAANVAVMVHAREELRVAGENKKDNKADGAA